MAVERAWTSYASLEAVTSLSNGIRTQINHMIQDNPQIIFCNELSTLDRTPEENKIYMELSTGRMYYYKNRFFPVGVPYQESDIDSMSAEIHEMGQVMAHYKKEVYSNLLSEPEQKPEIKQKTDYLRKILK